jgi:hypothetical protein
VIPFGVAGYAKQVSLQRVLSRTYVRVTTMPPRRETVGPSDGFALRCPPAVSRTRLLNATVGHRTNLFLIARHWMAGPAGGATFG